MIIDTASSKNFIKGMQNDDERQIASQLLNFKNYNQVPILSMATRHELLSGESEEIISIKGLIGVTPVAENNIIISVNPPVNTDKNGFLSNAIDMLEPLVPVGGFTIDFLSYANDLRQQNASMGGLALFEGDKTAIMLLLIPKLALDPRLPYVTDFARQLGDNSTYEESSTSLTAGILDFVLRKSAT